MEQKNLINGALYAIGAFMAIFHIVAVVFIPLPAQTFLSVHLFCVLTILYLRYPINQKHGKYIDRLYYNNVVFLILSIAISIYAFFNLENLMIRGGVRTTYYDIVFGFIAIIVILEGARRTTGLALPIIALFFMLYIAVGDSIPGMLGHTGYSINRFITGMYSYQGIYGTALATVATFVVMFMIFAAFLEKTGAGDSFLQLALCLAGKLRGGPAKVAVIASAFFGSISGSAVANVAGSGCFTIPLMKRTGYVPTFAGAVEAVASTGGQIMPPVMAAGAFLMAEFVGIKYTDVAHAALLPALLYFFSAWIAIDAEAGKRNLKGLVKEEIPLMIEVLKQHWLKLMPIVVLIILLVVFQYSALKSAFYCMLLSVIVCIVDKERKMGPKEIVDTLAESAKGIVSVAAACACAGLVIGAVSLTGFGLKLSTIIINFSGGMLIIALILSMVTAIIFGMGLPTTVSYILCVSVLSPVLINLGIEQLAAHMFIFYYACLSGITPPVALAAYTGAGIAGSKPLTTAVEATKLAIISYFLPYMFVHNNAYLLNGTILEITHAIISGVVLCFAIAAFAQGFLVVRLNSLYRIGFMVASVLLIYQTALTDAIGIMLFAVLYLLLRLTKKHENAIVQL
ncbi:MAG: TRAP transporter fused permease subunit [Dehalobacterium sp.]